VYFQFLILGYGLCYVIGSNEPNKLSIPHFRIREGRLVYLGEVQYGFQFLILGYITR